jgi:catechol 2,3-dioxygenase-like lactoylglutathione lyase family enzyme
MYLDYAGIRVRDLERSLRLFTRTLGLTELRRGTMEHGGTWVLLEDPRSRQRLELNWYPPGSKYDAVYVVGEGLDHLGFRTPDLDGDQRRLTDAGARVIDRLEEDGQVEVVFLMDPDGLWIELIRSPAAAPG